MSGPVKYTPPRIRGGGEEYRVKWTHYSKLAEFPFWYNWKHSIFFRTGCIIAIPVSAVCLGMSWKLYVSPGIWTEHQKNLLADKYKRGYFHTLPTASLDQKVVEKSSLLQLTEIVKHMTPDSKAPANK